MWAVCLECVQTALVQHFKMFYCCDKERKLVGRSVNCCWIWGQATNRNHLSSCLQCQLPKRLKWLKQMYWLCNTNKRKQRMGATLQGSTNRHINVVATDWAPFSVHAMRPPHSVFPEVEKKRDYVRHGKGNKNTQNTLHLYRDSTHVQPQNDD